MPKIALYGETGDELKAARAALGAFAPELDLREIAMFCDFPALKKNFFTLDMLLIKDCLFYRTLPLIQGIVDGAGAQKAAGQKIVVTSFTVPVTPKQINVWLDSLGVCDYIKIPSGGGLRAERARDVIYFENKDRKTYVKTSLDFYKTSLSLKEAMKLTPRDSFGSPYVSFWVNLYWVTAVKGRDVYLQNGESLPLSQKKAASFRRLYREYSEST